MGKTLQTTFTLDDLDAFIERSMDAKSESEQVATMARCAEIMSRAETRHVAEGDIVLEKGA